MKKLPKYLSTFAFALAVWGAFLVPNASAQSVMIEQTSRDSLSSPTDVIDTSFTFRTGQGVLSGSSTVAYIYASTTNTTSFSNQDIGNILVKGYTDSNFTNLVLQCGYQATRNAPYHIDGEIQLNYSSGNCAFYPNYYYEIRFAKGSGIGVSWQWYGANISFPLFSTTTVNNTDIAVPAFSLYGTFQSIDPNLIGNGNPSGIATSSTQSLCKASTASTTNPDIIDRLAEGFSFGICYALTFAFVPNKDTLSQFSSLIDQSETKIPFSYAYGIGTIFTGLTASSSQNLPTYSIGLSSIDFSSSTGMGPIFPNTLEFLSSTTINRYLPAGMHDLLYTFAIYVIWIETAYVLYRKVMPTKAKI